MMSPADGLTFSGQHNVSIGAAERGILSEPSEWWYVRSFSCGGWFGLLWTTLTTKYDCCCISAPEQTEKGRNNDYHSVSVEGMETD